MLELWDRFCGQAAVRHFTLNFAAAAMIFGGVAAGLDIVTRFFQGQPFLNLGVFLLIIGWGFLNYKSWARRWTVFLVFLALVACAVALVVALCIPSASYGLFYEVSVPYLLILLPLLIIVTFLSLMILTVLFQKETVAKFKQKHRAEHWTQILVILFTGAFLVQGWLVWKTDRFIRSLEVIECELTLKVRDAETGRPLKPPVVLSPPPALPGDIFSGPLCFSFSADAWAHTLKVHAASLAPFALRVTAAGYADTTLILCRPSVDTRLVAGGREVTLSLRRLTRDSEVTP